MPQITLTTADSAIAYSDSSVPQDLIDAWSYTTTFAQAYARTVNSDASSQGYFDAMTNQLQKVAWNVTEAGKLDYKQAASTISPSAIVSSILNPYLTAQQQNALAGILNGIQQPDTKATGFLDFFWKKASTNASKVNMAMGPLTVVNGSANITMIYYGFNFNADNWRSLFVARNSADLKVNAYNLEMNLNLALYNGVKSGLIEKLAGKEAAHIANTTIDI